VRQGRSNIRKTLVGLAALAAMLIVGCGGNNQVQHPAPTPTTYETAIKYSQTFWTDIEKINAAGQRLEVKWTGSDIVIGHPEAIQAVIKEIDNAARHVSQPVPKCLAPTNDTYHTFLSEVRLAAIEAADYAKDGKSEHVRGNLIHSGKAQQAIQTINMVAVVELCNDIRTPLIVQPDRFEERTAEDAALGVCNTDCGQRGTANDPVHVGKQQQQQSAPSPIPSSGNDPCNVPLPERPTSCQKPNGVPGWTPPPGT
jgi:hypothetical protein